MKADAIGNQCHANQQQEAQGQHLYSRMPIYESRDRPRSGQHNKNGNDDRRCHYPELVGHPDGGDHAVEREHDVEQRDLHDDAAKARCSAPRLITQRLAFQPLVDLARPLVEQEKAAADQDDVPPRNAAAEQFEQRLGEPDNPDDRTEQRQPRDQRQSQSGLSGALLPFRRQSPSEDRKEHQIVDAKHDLERGQG